jgi:uncharacterized protein YndB with AHSA1/START domain
MEPIVVDFDVAATPEHAFDVWTSRTSIWWPRSHTWGDAADLSIVFEPHVGGRIYERDPDGTEHDWGEVTVWEPPNRLECLWHLFVDRSDATRITVTFDETETGTHVRLVQAGFEKLGDRRVERRRRTESAWAELTARYQEIAES